MAADAPLELEVEAVHRHTVVMKVVGATSLFRGRRLVLLHPARSLVPFGLRCDSNEAFAALPRSIGATGVLSGRALSFTGRATFALEGDGEDLRVRPARSLPSPSLIRQRLEWLQPELAPDDAAREKEPLARALAGRLAAFAGRIRDGALVGADDLTRPLVGLGLGSTPSGDDMIAGALAALWSLGCAPATAARAAIAREVARIALDQTTRTSLEMLWHAARGYFPHALGALARALASASISRAEVSASAEALFHLGATSGRDMAAGLRAIFSIHCAERRWSGGDAQGAPVHREGAAARAIKTKNTRGPD